MSFVEKATLLLDDKSSKGIGKVNSELKKLMATAKQAERVLKSVGLSFKGVDKAVGDVRRLRQEFDKIRNKKVKIDVDASSVARAQSRLDKLERSTARSPKPIVLGVNTGRISQAINSLRQLHALAGQKVTQNIGVNQPRQNGQNPLFPNQRMPKLEIDVRPLRGLLREFTHDFRQAVLNYGYQSVKTGTVTEDVARTNLLLRNLTPSQNAEVLATAQDVAGRNTKVNSAQVLNILNEVLPMTYGDRPIAKGLSVKDYDIKSAGNVTEQLTRFVNLQMMRGLDYEKAFDDVFKIAKAFDQAGFLQDKSGSIDPNNVSKWVGNFLKASIVGGREVTPTLLKDTMKLMRSSKYGLNDEGFFMTMALAEMMGSTAGVGLNQMIKQLSGKGVTKEALAFQEEVGLTKTKDIEVFKAGGKKVTQKVVDFESTADARKRLRENPIDYVSNVVLPALLKSGQLDKLSSDDEIRAITEKILPPVEAVDKAGLLTSDRTATDTLSSLLITANNLRRDIEQMKLMDVSPERMKEIENQSLLVHLQGVNNQITGLAGDVADSLEGILIPALQRVNDALKGTSEWLKSEEDPNRADPYKASALIGGGAVLTSMLASWATKSGYKLIHGLLGAGKGVTTTAAAATTTTATAAANAFKVPRLGFGLFMASAAATLAELLKEEVVNDVRTKGDKGLTNALLDVLADVVVANRKSAQASRESGIVGKINQTPFTVLPPLSRAEMRSSGLLPMKMSSMGFAASVLYEDMSKVGSRFEDVFNTAESSLTAAGTQIGESIASSGQQAGQAILSTASQFGATAGASIAAAIRSAVSNISVNANLGGSPQPAAAVNPGKLGGPH